MSKGSYNDFLDKLGLLESNDNYAFVGGPNELGRYQVDEEVLVATGFMLPDSTPGVNDYAGRFTGRMSVSGPGTFLENGKAQDTAIAEYLDLLWAELGNRVRYEGQMLNSVRLNVSNLLAGTYLIGADAMKIFLGSGGITTPTGELFTYLSKLGGFDAPYVVDHSGDEHIAGGMGYDILRGFGGNDFLDGNGDIDAIYGGTGTDEINGGSGDDTLVGGAGRDTMHGQSGADGLNGGGDDDVLTGEGGTDSLNGGNGDDFLVAGLGNDVLMGEAGRDELDGGGGDDYMDGGAGSDTMSGGNGDDFLRGVEGNDTLDGGAGRDFMTGGSGNDTYVLSGDKDVIVESSGIFDGRDTAIIEAGGDYSFAGIEFVRIDSLGATEVRIASQEIRALSFDAEDGGTIRFEFSSAPEEKTIKVTFGAGADVFRVDDGGFKLATGIYNGPVQSGFFWGFDFQDVGKEDRIDLSSLGIDQLVTGSETGAAGGQYLLAPGARVEIGALFFENTTDGWFYLDSKTGLFSPSFSGDLSSGNFLI